MAETLQSRLSRVNQRRFARISLTGVAVAPILYRNAQFPRRHRHRPRLGVPRPPHCLARMARCRRLKTYDWRMRTLRQWSPSVNPEIVLVEIDDATIHDMHEIAGRWPWPRALSAVLIEYLRRGAPEAITVDIGFWEKEREGSYPFNGEEYPTATPTAN